MPYPILVNVEPALTNRNRLTTAFRLILAIPHLILVGGVGIGVASSRSGNSATSGTGEGGLLGAVAAFLAIVSWFTILITGAYPQGLYEFGVGALRWVLRVQAYFLLLVDEYPPFSLT